MVAAIEVSERFFPIAPTFTGRRPLPLYVIVTEPRQLVGIRGDLSGRR
jgi:hypothetical protein